MQVFFQHADEVLREWLEERRRHGNDNRDEVWDGVLHVVPPASFVHQAFESELEYVLRPIVHSVGLRMTHGVGVFGSSDENNFRVPDIAIASSRFVSNRGIEARAEVVIELLSPHDESRQKFEFYARCGIVEYWIVHPVTRATEIYVLQDGTYLAQQPDHEGTIVAPRLGLELRVVAGPKLEITWAGGSAEI